jgi:hypothetical protein
MADIKTETKISVLIEKINYLFQSIHLNNGAINKIDKDLLLNYERELYELTLSLPVDQPQVQQMPQQFQQPNYYQPQQPPLQQQYNPPPVYNPPPAQQAPLQQQAPPPQQQMPPPIVPNQNMNGQNGNMNGNGQSHSENGNQNQNNGQSIQQNYSGRAPQKTVSDIYANSGAKQTVNDKLNQPHNELNDKLRKAPIKDLKTFIGLNKRFSYINFLFSNDARLYDESIEKINNSSNYDEAMSYIESTLGNRLHWNQQDEMVAEFYNIVERRFLV